VARRAARRAAREAAASKYSILLHPVIWVYAGRTIPEVVDAFCRAKGDELLRKLEKDDIRVL
jgi:hypothetical protein